MPLWPCYVSSLVGTPGVTVVREEDIQKMLAAQVHIGTRNSDSQMQDYIWRRRQVCVFGCGGLVKKHSE